MFVVENDRICRESAVSVGEGGRVSTKAMRRPVPAAVIQRRTRQSLVSTMPAQFFIRPSIQRSPQYTVHAAQAHSALTWFSPQVETVARVKQRITEQASTTNKERVQGLRTLYRFFWQCALQKSQSRFLLCAVFPPRTHLLDDVEMECLKAFLNGLKSLIGIALFYAFSMTLTFFNNNIIKAYPFPLSITFFHLLMKFTFACIARSVISLYRGEQRVEIPWCSYVREVSPTGFWPFVTIFLGIASALDIGLSNWSFEFITVSLYTMTKSTSIIFVLLFAIILKLEKPSTQFDWIGFILVLSASAVSGIRWTAAQKLTQKSKFGLGNPFDVIYHTQPWMALTLLPLSFYFEIMELLTSPLLFRTEAYLPLFRTLGLFLCGALLAFGLECSEYFVVCHSSSLTLAVAGIFKELITLYLAATVNGDVSSPLNKIGLIICLTGICVHVGLKFLRNFSYRRHLLRFIYSGRWRRTSSIYEATRYRRSRSSAI
nr:unnamed protein product [Spirometra erinaceieuropaei]